jgi:hypothetical protein
MPTIYRISQPRHDAITDVGSVEAIEGAVRSGSPGCYHVDEISSDPLPSGHTSQRWGPRSSGPTARSRSSQNRGSRDSGRKVSQARREFWFI